MLLRLERIAVGLKHSLDRFRWLDDMESIVLRRQAHHELANRHILDAGVYEDPGNLVVWQCLVQEVMQDRGILATAEREVELVLTLLIDEGLNHA